MEKSIYEEKIRNLAWEFLLKQKINSLPLDINALCFNNRWHLYTFDEVAAINGITLEELINKYNNSDAVSRFVDGKFYIMYNDKIETPGRIRFNIMVEISQLCGTSLQASKYRFDRLKMLIKRNKFYSPLEKQVKEQFNDFIIKYCNKNNK